MHYRVPNYVWCPQKSFNLVSSCLWSSARWNLLISSSPLNLNTQTTDVLRHRLSETFHSYVNWTARMEYGSPPTSWYKPGSSKHAWTANGWKGTYKKILFWFWFCSRAFWTTPILHMHWHEAVRFLTASAIDSEVLGILWRKARFIFHSWIAYCVLGVVWSISLPPEQSQMTSVSWGTHQSGRSLAVCSASVACRSTGDPRKDSALQDAWSVYIVQGTSVYFPSVQLSL